MEKVYQRDLVIGDCMQACMASLFEDEYCNVPRFIELPDYFDIFKQYIKSKGYKFDGTLNNYIYENILHPTLGCFNNDFQHYEKYFINNNSLINESGVNGLFLCSVLSPKYFNWNSLNMHMVICDKNFNIIHDPNINYKNIIHYPLSDVIGYNGIVNVTLLSKIK